MVAFSPPGVERVVQIDQVEILSDFDQVMDLQSFEKQDIYKMNLERTRTLLTDNPVLFEAELVTTTMILKNAQLIQIHDDTYNLPRMVLGGEGQGPFRKARSTC